MSVLSVVAQSRELAQWLATRLDGLDISQGQRGSVSGRCFAIALDHHLAIATLVEKQINASACALARPLFEATIRGYWIAHCAIDPQVDKFILGTAPPRIDELVTKVNAWIGQENSILSQSHQQNWSALCAYTHTGAHAIQDYGNDFAIEPSHKPEAIIELLRYSDAIALFAALGVAILAGKEDLCAELNTRAAAQKCRE